MYPNLIIHDPDYPTADEIRRKSFVGDENRDHLIKATSRDGRNAQKPGREVEYMPNNWPDTPGSDQIVEILMDESPEPVYIQAWGGGNTASKAFYKLKTEYPDQYDREIAKAVTFKLTTQSLPCCTAMLLIRPGHTEYRPIPKIL